MEVVMKTLFRYGHINREERKIGINKINFCNHDIHITNLFNESLLYTMGVLKKYDVDFYQEISGKEIYYFYNKKVPKKRMREELDYLTSSKSNLEIADAIHQESNETIFWNPLSHYAIILGTEELAYFAHIIEEERWFGYHRDSNKPNTLLKNIFPTSDEIISKPVEKMLKLVKENKKLS